MICPTHYLASNHERYQCERIRGHDGACWHVVGRALLLFGVLPW